MRRLLAFTLLLTTTLFAQTPPAAPIYGFADPAKQQALEAKFDATLNRANLEAWMKRLAAWPHHTGSAYGKENAEFIASLFRSWGYDTTIERFDVLFPTPKTRLVELIAPVRYTANSPSPRSPRTRHRTRPARFCRRTTPTPPTATSRRSWCM